MSWYFCSFKQVVEVIAVEDEEGEELGVVTSIDSIGPGCDLDEGGCEMSPGCDLEEVDCEMAQRMQGIDEEIDPRKTESDQGDPIGAAGMRALTLFASTLFYKSLL